MATTTQTWIAPDATLLSDSQSLQNAQLVADHFIPTWSKNAICAVCGNMRTESTINPNLWELGHENDTNYGFGLTQWTPATKLMNWASSNGLDYTQGDTQLQRIDYEVTNNIQWIVTSPYNMTFEQFTQSTDSTDYLTEVWMHSYERPASYSTLPDRQAFASECSSSLDWTGSSSGGGTGTTPTPSNRTGVVNHNVEAVSYEKTGALNNMTYIEVKKGDSLSEIASKYGVSASTIKRVRFEDIANKNILYPGETLLLPKRDAKTPSVAPSYTSYTVKSGDTLSAISARFKVSVSDLQKQNGISNPDLIKVGQVLKV